MRLIVRAFAGLLSVFATASLAQTESLQDDFRLLQDVPVDYTVFGTICEQVARLRLRSDFPASKYDIETGIEYKVGGRTIGELDVVVFRKADREAIYVSEVKCRKGLAHAAHLAHEQLERFQSTIAKSHDVKFVLKEDPSRPFKLNQFDESPVYEIISQDGGKTAGFDRTIGHDIDAVKELREMLISCQNEGRCPKAAH